MEIAALVIAILAFISATALWFAKLENQIKMLKYANRLIYKELVEEYRLLIKAGSYVKYYEDFVEFNPHVQGSENECIRYVELESKIAEVKRLKARLCDTQCITKSYVDSVTLPINNGSDTVYVSTEELLKNSFALPKKKPRKQRKKK